MGCNGVEKLQTIRIHGIQLSVSITNYKVSQVSLFGGQLYLSTGGVQLGVAITKYKVSQVSLFGGQLYLSMGGVKLGVAITKYKVSHDHLPAPTHA